MGVPGKSKELKAEHLNGLQRSAVLTMALGPEGMEHLAKTLTPGEVEAISLEMARLGSVPQSIVSSVVSEWVDAGSGADAPVTGGFEAAREFLDQALGAESEEAFNRLQDRMPRGPNLSSLKDVDVESLATFLKGEHSQVVALVLAHLEAPVIAKVLAQMDSDLGAEVLFRSARMGKILPDVLEVVERFLSGEASLSLPAPLDRLGGPEAVAEVLNRSVPGSDKVFLDAIQLLDSQLALEIKGLMFVFEDLVRLDDTAMQRLITDIEAADLALSLKAASEELKAHLFRAMSQRAKAALEQEIDLLGPTRIKDVEEAQGRVVAEVRRLEEAGEIVLGEGEGDVLI